MNPTKKGKKLKLAFSSLIRGTIALKYLNENLRKKFIIEFKQVFIQRKKIILEPLLGHLHKTLPNTDFLRTTSETVVMFAVLLRHQSSSIIENSMSESLQHYCLRQKQCNF